jgi:hypothetical protein
LLQERKQPLIGKSTVGGEPDAAALHILKDQLERSFDDGSFVKTTALATAPAVFVIRSDISSGIIHLFLF